MCIHAKIFGVLWNIFGINGYTLSIKDHERESQKEVDTAPTTNHVYVKATKRVKGGLRVREKKERRSAFKVCDKETHS